MEFLSPDKFKTLANPGVTSVQLLSPHNSSSERVTITRVTVDVHAGQPRHQHDTSEQIWIAVSGSGTLLLAEDQTLPFQAGEVV
ncbi:MAG TPA: cupin domain-containing protein, partial [Anaerolineales bacterium]|nr:cupin domain-containing protein [Anaerolineales bacterium]